MSTEQAFAACEALVRQHDPDRYYSALFAPADKRRFLFALYAFNYEIARVAEHAREPLLGEIRMEWWRESVASARAGTPIAHGVARALTELFRQIEPPRNEIDTMLEARDTGTGKELFPNIETLEDYAGKTSSALMRLAFRVLGAGDRHDSLAHEAGIAYALTGLLRALPFHAAQRRLYLPADLLEREKLSPEEIFAGRNSEKLRNAMRWMAERAGARLASARRRPRPKKCVAAVLPVVLVPLYLKRMTKPWFDPFRMRADVPLARRQWTLLHYALRGRI